MSAYPRPDDSTETWLAWPDSLAMAQWTGVRNTAISTGSYERVLDASPLELNVKTLTPAGRRSSTVSSALT
jgi:hypothetical protein